MIITRAKPIEDILPHLEGKKNIFIVGCNVCAAKIKTGGEDEVLNMADRLTARGYPVLGWALPTAACSVRSFDHLAEKNEKIKDADIILAMGCGSGTSVIASVVSVPVTGTNETVSLGGLLGYDPAKNLCVLCGECNIGDFAGICPNARCPKSQMNGPCGGSKNHKCEVTKEEDCVWYLIEQRMDLLHMTPALKSVQMPKNHKV
ncbi:MAG: methylenetetrahydrofolate reductase C-terminal domain-containing protein [Methanimicrococcus sp.]|nr:methylenetetrahydrofolate reductase C-terminal domain-containing protein [Methanimicrococcus sp.]